MNDDIDEPDRGTWTFNGVSFEGVINEKGVAVTCFFYEEATSTRPSWARFMDAAMTGEGKLLQGECAESTAAPETVICVFATDTGRK